MWSIAHFKEDNSVEVVPSKWVTKYKCAWPYTNTKKYIESQSDPNTQAFNWFKARALLSNIESYSEGLQKCKKAVFTSDLSSSKNDTQLSKRKLNSIKNTNHGKPGDGTDDSDNDVHYEMLNYESDNNDEIICRSLNKRSKKCKIVSMHTSSPSTAFPIMKILSRKSGLHSCLECCFRCKNTFSSPDNPFCHIFQIRSIRKQNEILKIEPSLCVDSCLCDSCWKYVQNPYNYNKSTNENKKEETYLEKKSRLLERYVKKKVSKNKKQARTCSIHSCSQTYFHKMSVNECENIKELLLTFEFCHLVFIQSKKKTTDFLKFPFCLCSIHKDMILVLSTCQICGDNLNAPFDTNDWSMYTMWNCVLIQNELPLVLKPGMFICDTCKRHVSQTNPGFPTTKLPHLRQYIHGRNKVRIKLYGVPNLLSTCQGSKYTVPPIVLSKNIDEKKCVRSTKVKFSNPLITTNYNIEIGYCENDTESMTSTALLNVAEHHLYTPNLQPKDEVLDFISVEPPNAIIN